MDSPSFYDYPLPDFLCIGFFCHDIKTEGIALGGAASFSSQIIRHLGHQTAVLTSVGNDFKFKEVFEKAEIPIFYTKARETTVFENIYQGEKRIQYLHHRATTLTLEDLPKQWLNVPVIKFCLIADEVDNSLLHAFPNSLVAATIQGWLRHWGEDGKIYPKPIDLEKLESIDLVFMSDADIKGYEDSLPLIIEKVKTVVLTKGKYGATVYQKGKPFHFPAFPVKEVDPTGAGDVFAAAFLVHFYQTKDIALAANFAHAAASFIVEQKGNQIPPIEKIQERYLTLIS